MASFQPITDKTASRAHHTPKKLKKLLNVGENMLKRKQNIN